MGILDDVLVNAKSAAEFVTKKAGDIYDVSKLKLSEANLKSELNKKYQQYGKAVYNKESEEIVNNLEKEIGELLESIDDVSNLYNSLKNSKVCATCSQRIPEGSKYCPLCGAEQTTE